MKPTLEQERVIQTWGKGLAVLAGAGCGKTTTLVSKCQELLRLKPHARIAAVSFTEKSASDLREKLSLRLPPRSDGQSVLAPHWVTTIHGLCGSILREFPLDAGLDGEESILAESEAHLLWERALERLWFGDLKEEVSESLERLLSRESRSDLLNLLSRIRELSGYGVFEFLKRSSDPDSLALVRVAEYVYSVYEGLKQRKGMLDFNDLEKKADLALKSESVRAEFHRRFDLVLVDEFQDTNILQAQIIWKFVKPDLSNLVVVGDPKQSIYRFRDADVSVFEECCAQLPVLEKLTLNFRSRPGILHFTNEVCTPAFEASDMRYDSLEAGREAASPGLDPVVQLQVERPEELSRWIRAEQDKGVPLQDMVLLLRKIRGGNEKWLKALLSAGIPLAVGSGGLFWEDPRTRELAALLSWWYQPSNSLSAVTFLRAPWVKVSDQEIDQWALQAKTSGEQVGWAFRRNFFQSEHPLARELAPLLDRVVRPGEVLMKLLNLSSAQAAFEIERELGSQCLALWHRSEELSSRGLDSSEVVRELSEAMSEARREREVPPPRNKGQLAVMTLHAAKGLEFPHVILVDLQGKSRTPPSPLLYWDRSKGAFLARRDEEGERQKKDVEEKVWKDDENFKNVAESKRLFYVALTRAQERLVLVLPKEEEVYDPKTVYFDNNWRGWISGALKKIPLLTSEHTHTLPSSDLGNSVLASPCGRESQARCGSPVVWMRARHSVTEWNLLSKCERSYEWKFIRPLGFKRKKWSIEGESNEDSGMSARELGTRVHSCLEHLDFEGLKQLEQEAGSDRLNSGELMKWAQSSPLMQPPGGARKVWSELAFEVPVFNEVLVGAMDRLVYDSELNRYQVVDFKHLQAEKGADELLASYQFQMAVYSWAVLQLSAHAREVGVDAFLIGIHVSGIQVVEVSLPDWIHKGSEGVAPFIDRSRQIIDGVSPRPSPGPHCWHCDFRQKCDAAL